MSDETNGSGRLNRRQFLTLSAVGAGGWGLTGTVGAQSERSVQIPLARSGSDPVATESVPRSWMQNVRHARQATQQVARRLQTAGGAAEAAPTSENDEAAGADMPEENQSAVAIEPGDRRHDDMRGFRVCVRAGNGAARDAAPAEANGLPVRVTDADEFIDLECPNRGYYDPLPGGVAVHSDSREDEDLTRGSVTTAVTTDDSLRTYLMSAAHLFYNSDCDVDFGEDAYIADDRNNKVGGVVDWSIVHDYVLIRNTTGEVSYANTIREETDSSTQVVDVDGHLSESGVAYWLSKEKEVRNSGSTTGTTTGTLTEMYVWTEDCNSHAGHGVSNDARSGSGDSGGPVYGVTDGDAYMINMIQRGAFNNFTSCGFALGNDNWGSAAYRLHDRKGIVFDV